MVAIPDPERIKAAMTDPSPVESDSDWQTLPPAPASPVAPEDDPNNPFSYIPPIPPESEWPKFRARADRVLVRPPSWTEKMWQNNRYRAAVYWAQQDEKEGPTAEEREEMTRQLNRERQARWRERQRGGPGTPKSPARIAAEQELDAIEQELQEARTVYAEVTQRLSVVRGEYLQAQQRIVSIKERVKAAQNRIAALER